MCSNNPMGSKPLYLRAYRSISIHVHCTHYTYTKGLTEQKYKHANALREQKKQKIHTKQLVKRFFFYLPPRIHIIHRTAYINFWFFFPLSPSRFLFELEKIPPKKTISKVNFYFFFHFFSDIFFQNYTQIM